MAKSEVRYMSLRVSVTGHRPNKLYGYDMRNAGWAALEGRFLNWLLTHTDNTASGRTPIDLYTGMALGVDQIAAIAALDYRNLGHNINIHACIPCRNHPSAWPASSQRMYYEILTQVDYIHLIHDDEYQPKYMQDRNEFMVDNTDILLACWDGTKGGTGNCVRYAQSIGRTIERIPIR